LVLKLFSSLLASQLRNTDLVARYGGEEFCVLLPETGLSDAVRRIDAVRHAIEATPIEVGRASRSLGVNFSSGVACFPRDGSTPRQLISQADRRLYEAKAAGRGCVVGEAE
jgi:diguanylate cyclase (GGDEF)-like protein